MTGRQHAVIDHMQALIDAWQAKADQRAVFLNCYRMMTGNMLEALNHEAFDDPPWVDRLLHQFAGYYFHALEAYEREPGAAPSVWRLAFERAQDQRAPVLQKLLLGVNAHINYDLVLTVDELLQPEWGGLAEDGRERRYRDYTQVNAIIAATIDAVQDQILEPAEPVFELFDRLLGPVDELLISRMINAWRENVWRSALELLESRDPLVRAAIVQRVEREALRIGDLIT